MSAKPVFNSIKRNNETKIKSKTVFKKADPEKYVTSNNKQNNLPMIMQR